MMVTMSEVQQLWGWSDDSDSGLCGEVRQLWGWRKEEKKMFCNQNFGVDNDDDEDGDGDNEWGAPIVGMKKGVQEESSSQEGWLPL